MKKIFSFLLLAAGLMMSTTVMADPTEVGTLSALKTAIKTAQDIKLTGDISLTSSNGAITFAAVYKGTLDLNGHKIERLSNNNYVLDIPSGAEVTLVDNGSTKGWIKGTPLAAKNKVASLIRVKGKLTLGEEGKANGAALISDYCCVKVDEDPGAGVLVINSGSCTIIPYSGETVYQPSFAVMNWATATINGGTFNGNVQTLECKDNNASKYGTTTINGGSFTPAKLYFYAYDAEYVPQVTVDKSITNLTAEVQYGPIVIKTTTDGAGNTVYASAAAAAKIGTKTYETLADAVAVATANQVISLQNDIAEDVTLPSTFNGYIYLNGKTWTNKTSDNLTVTLGAKVTIYGTGTLDNLTHGKATIVNNGTVVLNGGKYVRSKENGQSSSNNGGNSYYTILNHGAMTINAGVTVEQNGHYSSMIDNGYYSYNSGTARTGYVAGTNAQYPSLTINGGTFTGGLNTIKNDDAATLVINGGTFTNYTQAAVQNNNVATINGGTFNAESVHALENKYYAGGVNAGTLAVTGGEFVGGLYISGTNAKYTISGGTFSVEVPAAYCAPGYAPKKNAEGKYEVEKGYSRAVTAGNYGTICLPNASSSIEGMTLYSISSISDKIYLTEVSGQMVAGHPYIFKANADAEQIHVTYTGEAVSAPDDDDYLVGSFEEKFINENNGNYIIYNNLFYFVDASETAKVGANRAYIHYESSAAAPRLGFVISNPISTDVENVAESEKAMKTLVNGKIVILRAGQKYDVNGKLVK